MGVPEGMGVKECYKDCFQKLIDEIENAAGGGDDSKK